LIRRCVADLPRVLAPAGAAFLECDPPQAAAIVGLLGASGLRGEILRDLSGNERVVVGRRP
jgi:methylase of polypeptide subunit release factors